MAWISAPKAALGTLGAALIVVSTPATAQEARLERIERQLNALQRAVFPGGDERFFEPEITPQTQPNPQGNTPQVTTSALTDVLARLDAIEQQLARLTAATEVNENALSALEARVMDLEAGRAASAPSTPPPSSGTRPSGTIPVPEDGEEVALPEPPDPPAQSGPSAERVAAVEAIVMPATGDAGEDAYTYGFRLWDAGFYPEAQQQLALYLEQHPGHRLNSRGRNLLGRAFLDAGEPRAAATHFFENYQNDSAGDRAPDSLLYLAESMIALGDTRRACIALAEFGETYPALAVGRLQGMYEGLGGRVDCD